jgi:hypothetical protein
MASFPSTKIWPINGTGSYVPASNTQVLIQGVVGTTGISGVSASAVTAIQALGASNVKITELGLFLSPTGTTGTNLAFAGTYTGVTGDRQVHYYNGKRPAFDLDGPIYAFLASGTAPAAFTVIDSAGNTATFPAGSLKQGTVYNIQINTVVSTTAGDFIGLGEF